VRTHAFATNAVYEVDANEQHLMVKASMNRDALRGEVWACARAAAVGFPAPEVLVDVRGIGPDVRMSAYAMGRIRGRPITRAHPAFRELGVILRSLHAVKVSGFGTLAEATWDPRGGFTLSQRSWPALLTGICIDTRSLADSSALAIPVADAVEAVMNAHAAALSDVEGCLCHGDLKANHIFVEGQRLTGVIDWGDAVVGDPLWEIARYAHRGDAQSLSMLLSGYDPQGTMADEIVWRIPLYSVAWMLVDAVVDHRLGSSVDGLLNAAIREIARVG
jgi:aminoglycoside phosphotransferase (APT) family kinase protein